MKVTFFEQCELKCRQDELEKALKFLGEGKYKVQVITYNQMVNGGGRMPGIKIIAARPLNGKKATEFAL